MKQNSNLNESKATKWGWGLLLIVSAIIILQGVGAFFASSNTTFLDRFFGVSMIELEQSHPFAADAIQIQTANFGILSFVLGLLALIMALQGLRHSLRWVWGMYWIIVGGIIVIAVNQAAQSGEPDVPGLFLLGLALTGQLLASWGRSSEANEVK